MIGGKQELRVGSRCEWLWSLTEESQKCLGRNADGAFLSGVRIGASERASVLGGGQRIRHGSESVRAFRVLGAYFLFRGWRVRRIRAVCCIVPGAGRRRQKR